MTTPINMFLDPAEPIYVGRVEIGSTHYVGTVRPTLKACLVLTSDGTEEKFEKYEALVRRCT